jgi:hypothetical protein
MNIDGIWFKDDAGRTLILRGTNLGGSTKVPMTPDGATWRSDHFYDHHNVSFVGRPFPLEEADEHLSRLRAWGMTFLRFLITWEAIEHTGPGQYDEEYLDYLYAVCKKAGEYDIQLFIDPHQDVWSRWTGGDGAPGWTLEAVGMDLRHLHTTGAAITHQTHGDPFPRMIWPSNYSKLGAATMFTLFFAGNDFAPATKIDGVPAQEYLQSHYINAIKQVALRLKDLPNVIGYDSLNEPGSGYIGLPLNHFPSNSIFLIGEMPTPIQSFALGAGYPQEVGIYEQGFTGPQTTGKVTLNPQGVKLWRDGYECVWKQNGVWTDEGGTPRLLKPEHFMSANGQAPNFANDYMKPFILRFVREIRAVHPDAILFLEGAPGGEHPHWGAGDPDRAVDAAHWYDVLTLFTKTFNPEFTIDFLSMQPVQGEAQVAQAFVRQLGEQKHATIPTLIGEFGIPFDLDNKRAYSNGNFSTHTQALDLYYDALDANLLNATIWNYTADNTNARGEGWNDEDLSIFSRDQQDQDWHDDIHAGGRGVAAIARPYARKIAGEPLRMTFDLATRTFTLEYKVDHKVSAPTEIFIPDFQYPKGYAIEVTGGTYSIDQAGQKLIVTNTNGTEVCTVKVTPLL